MRSKKAVVCIDLAVRHPEHEAVVTASRSAEYFREAQRLHDLWAMHMPKGDVRELTVEIEWEGGVAFAAEMHLAHPSREMPIEERDIAAHVVHYLRYCIGEIEVWPPTLHMVRAIAKADPDMFQGSPEEVARSLDFRDEEKRAWAQHILDTCWLPEVANA